MRGMIGGILTGGLVTVIGLGTVSVLSEQPAGAMPPETPLVDAPMVETVETVADIALESGLDGPSSPVGSVSIDEPVAPELPESDQLADDVPVPVENTPDTNASLADTDPLDEPDGATIEGAMQAPETSDVTGFAADLVEPVLPTPLAQAPQTPNTEANLTVSTAPSQPVIVVEPEPEVEVEVEVVVEPVAEAPVAPEVTEDPVTDTFVVDLGADAVEPEADPVSDAPVAQGDAPADAQQNDEEDIAVASVSPEAEAPDADSALIEIVAEPAAEPTALRLQLQGGENALLTNRDTGVTIRRPIEDVVADPEVTALTSSANALQDYAAPSAGVEGKPLLAIVLIDDGTMSAAAAALAGLPFSVTIALDPALPNAAELMANYRADGFEVAVLAKLPEGALPSDVEVTFESVFGTLPEAIAVLDIGDGGLQADRDVTEQAMEILASQGRGFVTASQGLNMAGRAAQAAGVPAAVIFRDLDVDGQDARIVRRFVDQAAFRARQDSGVVLVGRVRPETISALILWGTANQDDQVALVPVSAILKAQ